jgi:hypothetical protein
MRRLIVRAALATMTSALMAACAAGPVAEPGHSSGAPAPRPPSSAAPDLPPSPQPAAERECPYLDTDFVARANGQHVGTVRVSDGEAHPACFFYRPDGDLQLTVRVYVGKPAVATGLVDQAAPVSSSNPTRQPSGWKGGYQSSDDGAVYAVAKGPDAVIVTTNQRQSVKARTVARQAIETLRL